jgi:diguanylate cyclase (GGDEF)-like protein
LHDPLTGLPNRTLLHERLRAVFSDPVPEARVGLCLLGVDRFKAVNDTLGYEVGDLLLAEVAARLDQSAGERGRRWAGDEFGVLVTESTGVEQVVGVADRMLSALSTPVRAGGHWLPVSVSIGVVERPVAGTDASEMLRAAGMTLRQAKADGGGRWAIFDPRRAAGLLTRHALAAALPAALACGEFTVAYQPIVDLRTGAVAGAEALVRWRHPELGAIGPDQFVDLAEETALIVPLGWHVLDHACRQAAGWAGRVADAPFVSVNLAARQIRHRDLVEDLIGVLDRTGLPAGRLQLEITESAVVDTGEETVTVLEKIADLGVPLALDDFGTGYCNLAYLGALPIRAVKLAGSFAARLDALHEPAGRITAGLIDLLHDIGLHVTAEGIETAAQAGQLAALGCDTGQGWHLGRPTSAGELLDRRRPQTP